MGDQQRIHNYMQVSSRSGTLNNIILKDDHAEIHVYNPLGIFQGIVYLDLEDVDSATPLRLNNGYAYLAKKGTYAVHHIVMNHSSNREVVVDHIDGNPCDNRKRNLRVVPARDNASNRNTTPKNNTGVVGIVRRKHPTSSYEYFRATVSDRTTPMKGASSKTKQISKNFNINKYGEILAMELAVKWLQSKKKEFGYLL